MKGYVDPEVLVTTQWMADHMDDPQVRLVEFNEDILLYELGHIPRRSANRLDEGSERPGAARLSDARAASRR